MAFGEKTLVLANQKFGSVIRVKVRCCDATEGALGIPRDPMGGTQGSHGGVPRDPMGGPFGPMGPLGPLALGTRAHGAHGALGARPMGPLGPWGPGPMGPAYLDGLSIRICRA